MLQIASRDAVIDHARAIVRNAKTEIYVSLWSDDLDPLRDDLAAADERGVRIFGMLYGEGDVEVGWWQHHSYRETVASRIGGRMLTIVADGSEALIAHMPERGDPSAVRTRNPVLCLVAEEYLIHDLTLQKAKTMTGFEEWDQWLRADEKVRALTVGRTGTSGRSNPGSRPAPPAEARRTIATASPSRSRPRLTVAGPLKLFGSARPKLSR